MKILAKKGGGYICDVQHEEIEKFLNLYYNDMPRLAEGDICDLGRGYDFYRDTHAALKKTEEFIKAHQKTIKTILSGISMVARQ